MSTTTFENRISFRPRQAGREPYGRYVGASVGLMAIAAANGVTRELTYGKALNDDVAHWLSLAPMVGLFAVYVNVLERRWPFSTWRGAFAIGATWAVIAVGSELGVGHYVDGKSWSQLLHEYNLVAGRSGAIVLAATAVMPAVVRVRRLRLERRNA